MKIKHLYNHHAEPVGKAHLHKRNATVDIEYDEDKIHYGFEYRGERADGAVLTCTTSK